MHYIEYSTSAGPGALIEHGVVGSPVDNGPLDVTDVSLTFGRVLLLSYATITPERYQEFVAIHGGEKDV